MAAVGSPHEPACEMGSSHLPAYLLRYYPGSVAKMDGLLVWWERNPDLEKKRDSEEEAGLK